MSPADTARPPPKTEVRIEPAVIENTVSYSFAIGAARDGEGGVGWGATPARHFAFREFVEAKCA
jgi:hypothetical protein